jgi:hypothetical protein
MLAKFTEWHGGRTGMSYVSGGLVFESQHMHFFQIPQRWVQKLERDFISTLTKWDYEVLLSQQLHQVGELTKNIINLLNSIGCILKPGMNQFNKY